MRKLLLGLAVLTLSAGAAFAGEEAMASRFGNTTVIEDGSGATTKLYYNADHSFTGSQGDVQLAGTWKVDGAKVCVTFSGGPPPGYPPTVCTPLEDHAVGDSWQSGPFKVSLVAGVQ